MSVRSVFSVALAASLGLAAPAIAKSAVRSVAVKAPASRGVDPARILVGGTGRGFADRTSRLTSIMGPETGGVARMQIPLQPEHPRGLRREADATASLR